jgi:hypothetical protein
MAPTRRALIVGLAVLPAFATTTTTAASADPIFAAIERHRAARAALEALEARYAAAEQEITAAYDAMLATAPQTIAGSKALVDHMIEDGGADVDEALAVLRRDLDRLAAA